MFGKMGGGGLVRRGGVKNLETWLRLVTEGGGYAIFLWLRSLWTASYGVGENFRRGGGNKLIRLPFLAKLQPCFYPIKIILPGNFRFFKKFLHGLGQSSLGGNTCVHYDNTPFLQLFWSFSERVPMAWICSNFIIVFYKYKYF